MREVLSEPVIAIGASAGGPQAIEYLLRELDTATPAIVITQHMPENFTRAFAGRMHEISRLEVKEAAHGDLLAEGRVLIAPGGKQLRLRRLANAIAVELSDEPPVNRHKPSVDVLFESLAALQPQHALAVLLTGMGNDGARGMKILFDLGYRTLAQDEATATVWGMPREAVRMQAVAAADVLPLSAILKELKNFAAH
ncbi:MAG: chemotaxis protein CheB [Spirochaetes bacterium]|nr:chemotaxis protein CheB [Spirochaetota bacterium]